MTARLLAERAYQGQSAATRTPRGIEYDAFVRITRRLVAAARLGNAGFTALASAVHENRRLWTILAADVADNANALPTDLRARIFYLAEFTAQHSSKVLAKKASVKALIDINAAIMRGLSGTS